MENVVVGCVQPRMSIFETHEEFENLLRRFLRQPQAKSARLVVFPELMGVMLAPPLISGGRALECGCDGHPPVLLERQLDGRKLLERPRGNDRVSPIFFPSGP